MISPVPPVACRRQSSPRRGPCRGRCAAVFAAAFLTCAPLAAAQSSYVLGEDDQWQATEAPEPGSPEGQLLALRRTVAQGDGDRAESLAEQWIERHPRHPLLPEAYLLRGDARVLQQEHYRALFDYEYIARRYPGSDAFITALEREFEIAKLFAGGMKRKFWGMRVMDASEEAEEIFIRVQERLPGSRLAEQAGMALADFYYDRGMIDLAVVAYELYIENYPDSARLDRARQRLVYSHLASFKGPEFDPTGLYEAQNLLREMQAVDPVTAQKIGASGLLVRIEESDAQKLLETARWYVDIGDYISAEFTIRRLVRHFPRSVAATAAMDIIPGILQHLPSTLDPQLPDYDAFRRALLDPKVSPPPMTPPPDQTPPASPEVTE